MRVFMYVVRVLSLLGRFEVRRGKIVGRTLWDSFGFAQGQHGKTSKRGDGERRLNRLWAESADKGTLRLYGLVGPHTEW